MGWVSIWLTRGELVAATECSLISLDSKLFMDVMLDNPQVAQVMSTYAAIFTDWLNSFAMEKLTDMAENRKGLALVHHFVERASSHVEEQKKKRDPMAKE